MAEESAEITWTPEAKARLEKAPVFIRPMIKKGVEKKAKARGLTEITEELMDEAKKEAMG